MNVTLIGMAGAGKSHIGNLLAKKLGLEFIDVDRHLWESINGKPVQEILDERGEKWFLDEEERLIIEHTKGKDGLLISPPGSVVYQPKAMQHLKEISKVVYLRVPFATIDARLKGMPLRGIVGLGKKTLRELYDERTPKYESFADLTINTEGKSSEGIAREIMRFLGKK